MIDKDGKIHKVENVAAYLKVQKPVQVQRYQTRETIFMSTRDRKCLSSNFGMRPPEMSTPASMFLSIAYLVRFALVIKHVLPSATATLACTRPSENASALSRQA